MSKRTSSPALMIRMVVVLAPLLFLIMSFSGCIQTEMFKDLFFKEENKELVWGVEEVVDIRYKFTDSYIVETYSDQENFLVKDQALWFILSIEIKFHIAYTSSVPDRRGFELNPDREVKLTITDPSGNIKTHIFENSVIVNLDPVLDPEPGLWRIRVDAQGRGFDASFLEDSFYDEFSVIGRLNQPED